MSSVDQYNLTTVINRQDFLNTVQVKECPTVGRTLVTKRDLVPGDIVLVEEPLIKYDLKPTCRSTKSPYHSKKLWQSLVSIVQAHEEPVEQPVEEVKEEESNDGYTSEEENDEEDEEPINTDSEFCPGIPAAMMAYLTIHPPVQVYTNVRARTAFAPDDFDFFYYPDETWIQDHTTVSLVHTVSQQVVATEPLFAHVDAQDLARFVLKIYSNAHTVSLPRARDTPTHSHKKYRRDLYKDKFEENDTYWGDDAEEPANTPTIALLRWGSKFAHSCSPNMFLRFEPTRNAMVFTVIQPLKAGDVLSFSYLPEDDLTVGGLICSTVVDRQAKLNKFKFFTCACERCTDWDWSRGVICQHCQETTFYKQGKWTCCAEPEPTFIGEREKNVQRMVMGFASRVYGNRKMNQAMMRMLEPYLDNLLEPKEEDVAAVPKHHWTYSVIHVLLSIYHISLFPQSFGKGLASQLGLLQKGLEEALVYIEFLNTTIRTHGNEKSTSHGNPMAAFFAGWRILTIVFDLIMDTTENKYANVTYEPSDSSDSDSDSDSDSEEESVIEEEEKEEEKEEEREEEKEEEKVAKEEEEENTNGPVVTEEPVLIPLPQDWVVTVSRISDIVSKEWIPLIELIFASHDSVVVQDMIAQIKAFSERVEKTKNLE